MKFDRNWTAAVLLTSFGSSQLAQGECIIADEAKSPESVEVGFCESDAVFIGKSEGAIETIGGQTEEGSTTTKHFRIQRSTIKVVDRFKGALPDKVTLIANLYAKDGGYVFESGKTYLIFAKRLAGENEYVGASAACSLQPTLPIEEADKVLKQLHEHGRENQETNCQNSSKN